MVVLKRHLKLEGNLNDTVDDDVGRREHMEGDFE